MATVHTNISPEFDPMAPEEHDWGRATTGIGPGLLAGLIMAIILVILSLARGVSAFAPALVIASTLLGPGAMTGGAGVIFLGVVVHFASSALLGALFTTVFGRTTMRRSLGFGLFYGLFIWAIAQFIILPLANPAEGFLLGNVWPFLLAHVSYGLVLAASVPTVKDIDAPEREYIDPLRREVRP